MLPEAKKASSTSPTCKEPAALKGNGGRVQSDELIERRRWRERERERSETGENKMAEWSTCVRLKASIAKAEGGF